MKKIGFAAVLCCMLCSAACSGKKEDHAKREMTDQTNAVETAAAEVKTLDDYIEVATRGCKVVKEHEDVQQGTFLDDGHITFRVDKVTVTKQQGNWVDLGIEPDLDNQRKIIGEETYVVVDVTVRQEGEYDFWWNDFELTSFKEDDLRPGPSELVSVSVLCNDKNVDLMDSNVYHRELPEGEDIKTSLVFVIEDRELNEEGRHFLLEYNPTGASHEFIKPEEYSMVFLESMEDKDGWQSSSE